MKKEEIEYYLTRNKLSFENLEVSEDEKDVSFLIDMGDWKHDHLFARTLMAKIGYEKTAQYDLMDGDIKDTYSAIHYYKLLEKGE